MPDDRILTGRLELREALGSEIMAHFAIKAAHAETDEMRELAEDVGAAETTPQIGVSEDEAVDRRPLRGTLASQGRAKRCERSSTRARCTSSTRKQETASTTPRKETT